jgi:hypothetical protein
MERVLQVFSEILSLSYECNRRTLMRSRSASKFTIGGLVTTSLSVLPDGLGLTSHEHNKSYILTSMELMRTAASLMHRPSSANSVSPFLPLTRSWSA